MNDGREGRVQTPCECEPERCHGKGHSDHLGGGFFGQREIKADPDGEKDRRPKEKLPTLRQERQLKFGENAHLSSDLRLSMPRS